MRTIRSFVEYRGPGYRMCLKAEFWAERDLNAEWTQHFVTMAFRNKRGKLIAHHVPILPTEYLRNPTVWPKGFIGTFQNNF